LLVLGIAGAIGAARNAGSVGPGLVAAYSFDEGVGAAVADASGNGNVGSVAGAAWTTDGRHGGALSFDGVNDRVDVADSASLDLTAGMTLEAWLYPTSGGSWRTVVLKEQGTSGLSYALYAQTSAQGPSGHVQIGSNQPRARSAARLAANTWSHVAATHDGATVRLYVNGVERASAAAAGTIAISASPLRIGGNAVWNEWFGGRIDDLRIYDRALSAAEIQGDMTTPVGGTATPPDTTPPTAPADLTVTSATRTAVTTRWTASADAESAVTYHLFRNGQPQGTTSATTATFGSLTCGTAHDLAVEARDVAGNVSPRASVGASAAACDTTPPQVAVTAPAAGEVSGTVAVAASASDDEALAGVQFRLDGAALGAEDTAAPYSVSWSTPATPNGPHTLTAVARDASGNLRASEPVAVTVANSAPPPGAGLVAAYSFYEGAGTAVLDSSGRGNAGTVAGASWAAGRFGSALSFDGVDDRVDVADSAALDLTNGMTLEAWVYPTALGSNWRTAVLKERTGNLVYALYAHNVRRGRPSGHVFVGSGREAAGTAILPVNAWTHLAATYDGAALRLYVGGAHVSTLAVTGSMAASTGALRIGGNAVWGEWFAGLIDEVRVYNRALTVDEIQADLATPVPVPPPPPALAVDESSPSAHAAGTQAFYDPDGSGSFRVSASVAAGVTRVAFPAVFGADGGEDSNAPFERAYSWGPGATASGSRTVTALDPFGLSASASFTLTPDADPPSGGSISYADGYDADGVVALALESGVDALSGLDVAATRVEVATAQLSGGTCGTYGPWEPAASPPQVASGACARFRAVVADRVGNTAVLAAPSVVRVDATPPAPVLELSESGANAHVAGTTLFYRGSGGFDVAVAAADAESGVARVEFPALFGADAAVDGDAPYAAAYGWDETATADGGFDVTAVNGAGLSATARFDVRRDVEPPAGGSVLYAGGYDADGVVGVALDAGTDALSGLDPAATALEVSTAPLSAGACGTFGPFVATQSPHALGAAACARFRVRAADRVGNETAYESPAVARFDAAGPTPPALTLSETGPASHVAGTTLYYRPGEAGAFGLAAETVDDESGLTAVAFPDVFGADGTTDSDAPYSAAYAWDASAAAEGSYTVGAANGAGATASGAFEVRTDAEPPAGGSIAYVDGYDADGVVDVAVTPGSDGGSGVDAATEVVELATAQLAGDLCGAFGGWRPAGETIAEDTCARYRARVSDHVGNEATYSSPAVVRVDAVANGPLPLTITETEPDEHVAGTTLFYNGNPGSAGSFTVTADAPDAVRVDFPEVFGADSSTDTALPYAASYAWTAATATVDGDFVVRAEEAVGTVATAAFSVRRDVDSPTGGFVEYADGFDSDGHVVVDVGYGFDALSGLDLASATFERQTAVLQPHGGCGSFGNFVAAQPVDTVAEGRCAKYRARIFDNVGNRITYRSAREVKVDLGPPTQPGSLVQATTGATSARVSWTASTDGVGVVGYWVLRDGVRTGSTSGTSYELGWLGCERTYDVGVEAVDGAGNASARATVTVATGACPPAEPADVYVAPAGSDAAPCTETAPCASLNRAYRVALPGQTVELAGGAYPAETIAADPAKVSTSHVLFRPAAGAEVTFGYLGVEASHVTVRGIRTAYTISAAGNAVQAGVAADRGSDDVVLEDVDAGHVFIAGDRARVLGGDYGPTADEVSKVSGSAEQTNVAPVDVVVDGAFFHDYLREDDHMECLAVAGANGLAIRNSRFHNCAVFALFLKAFGAEQTMRDVTIENNFFGNSLSIEMSAMIKVTTNDSGVPCENVVVRNNSVSGKLVLSDCAGSVRWDSNVLANLPEGVCEDSGAGTVFAFNVIERGAPCGPTDLLLDADAGYVDEEALDLHLAPGSAAIDRGNPLDFPAADIDGDARPGGSAPDAGADELP
jgi:Concanavalin A-like lectin/glucanases superfamily/Bacterial Ig domain